MVVVKNTDIRYIEEIIAILYATDHKQLLECYQNLLNTLYLLECHRNASRVVFPYDVESFLLRYLQSPKVSVQVHSSLCVSEILVFL